MAEILLPVWSALAWGDCQVCGTTGRPEFKIIDVALLAVRCRGCHHLVEADTPEELLRQWQAPVKAS